MKKTYKNKIIVFILLFIIILNFLKTNTKAGFADDFPNMIYPEGVLPNTNYTDTQAGKTRYVCNKVLVKYNENNSYYIINYISADYSNTRRLYITTNNIVEMEGILYKQYLRWDGSNWTYAGWSGFSGGNPSNVSGEPSYTTLVNNCEIISASKDIYSDNTFSSLFFLSTPLGTRALVEIMEQEKEQLGTIQEILGILPLIIVILVSLVGFRKALKMLLTFLKTS